MSEPNEASTIVDLESDLIGQDPEALKQQLLAALVPGRAVLVQAGDVARAGTAALQLLVAFVRDAQAKGIAVSICDASPALRDAVVVSGLHAHIELQAAG